MPPPLFRFSHRLRVRWAEVDAQGVVFNANYLAYFDVAMTEYLRELPYPYPQGLAENGTDLYLVKSSLEYKGSARYDDLLDLHARIGRIGRTSLTFEFDIRRKDEDASLVVGTGVYVNVDLQTRRPAQLPPRLVELAVALEGEGIRAAPGADSTRS